MGNRCMGALGCPGVGGHEKTRVARANERFCTDLPFLFLFVALWGVMIYLTADGLDKGADPTRLANGYDYLGNTCKMSQYVAYPVIEDYKFSLCVDSCDFTSNEDALPIPYESVNALGRCAPMDDNIVDEFIADNQGMFDETQRYIADLSLTKWIILAASGIALSLSLVFVWLSQRVIEPLVWICIVGTMAFGIVAGALLINEAVEMDNSPIENETNSTLLYVFGSISLFLTLVFTVLICALRKQIKIAMEIVKEASKSILDMPTLLFFPFYPFVFVVGFFAFWIYVTLVLWTIGDFSPADAPESLVDHVAETGYDGYRFDEYVVFTRDKDVDNLLVLHFFFMLWVLQFIIYVAYTILAGVFCQWYFTRENEDANSRYQEKDLSGCHEMCNSTARTFVFHLGTVALGSLIIAIINFVRAILTYIQKKTQDKQSSVQKALFCCCQCCLWCVRCCCDKINKNAFIFTALYGDAFCVSAWDAFRVLFKNIARVAAINMVGEWIIILGKILITASTTGICALILTEASPYKEDLYSLVLPLVVIGLVSYVVGSCFMELYEVAIDVLFLCFLVDEDARSEDQTHVMYASQSLQDIIEKYSAKSKKEGDAMKKQYADTAPLMKTNKNYGSNEEEINFGGDN